MSKITYELSIIAALFFIALAWPVAAFAQMPEAPGTWTAAAPLAGQTSC